MSLLSTRNHKSQTFILYFIGRFKPDNDVLDMRKSCYRLLSSLLKVWLALTIGPQQPTYPDVCCDEFRPSIVCDGTIDNIVGSLANIPDISTCQAKCQVCGILCVYIVLLSNEKTIVCDGTMGTMGSLANSPYISTCQAMCQVGGVLCVCMCLLSIQKHCLCWALLLPFWGPWPTFQT
jgi:hypothetical protein